MYLLFSILFLMNCLAEYLLNKIMLSINVLERKHLVYHSVCAFLRILWVFGGAWFAVPIPVFLIGLLLLLFLNIVPYRNRTLLMSNFIMIIYLIYITLMMTVVGVAGLTGLYVNKLVESITLRVLIMNTTFLMFDVICVLLLHYHPEFLWKEDYDKSKVVIYTRFLSICVIYHILDAVIVTAYQTSWINYLLLVSGDILILILMFNFLNYNYVFAKSKDMRRVYEESEALIARQYFEKESLKKLSEFDALTNTYNRREISSIMLESIQNGHKLACVFIDLDGLKRTNDKYGHTFGDLMLKRFADACLDLLRGKGYLARIGGDEFLLIFLDEKVQDIERYIRNLQLKLLEPAKEKDKIFFSYGISYGEASVDDYISLADRRMYEDKNRKRCGVL